MRKILFRGKSIYSDEWYFGSYISGGYIMMYGFDQRSVDPETVGQFTGLTDKNDKMIFEGDVVKGKDHLARDFEVYGYVDHKNGSFVIVGDFMTHYRWIDYDLEVIGNIHDNPELLEE